MRWEQLPIYSTFERARRREAYRRFARTVRRRGPESPLPDLEDYQNRIRLFEQSYVGVEPIPVASIVGTAGGSADFDKNFLPRRPEVRERWTQLERAFPTGEFPPIAVYRLGDSYFVVDGHHRVAVARQMGIDFIDAEVTELRARFEIPAGADIGRMIHAEQQALFMDESGLGRACPEADIEFTKPQGYVELLELIKVHAYDVSQARGALVSMGEAARDFYDHVYKPTVEAIRNEELHEAFGGCTEADLFLWVYERSLSLFPEHGEMELEDVVRQARDEKISEGRWPVSLRGTERGT
jgi:hypothetical protein